MTEYQTIQLKTINDRYSSLSKSTCCLSCGGAINHAGIKPGEVCVDLGSGRGNDVIRLADMAGECGYAYGVDISEGMIEKAESQLRKFDIKNASIIKSELEDIELPDDIADVVISNCTINHAADKDRVWAGIFRILKTGGRFIVSDIYSLSPVPEEYRNDPQAVAECWAGSVTRGEFLESLEKAGFSDIKIIEESEPYAKGKIEVSSWTITGYKK
jgi:ubiquinone/menaquinone biosynthesis C-methylase UbiE